MEGSKLLNFEIGKSILQNGENRETKTAIKAFHLYKREKLDARLE